MMFPLYPQDAFGYPAAMAMGTAIGVAFGFVLERSGFGRANVLVGQFLGTDNRVFKVMFTGILTACTGVGLLSGLGLLDVSALSVPETFWGPQLVGGLLLGVGFAVCGYCPGTAVVSAGSGHRDGWLTLLGVVLGAFVFAAAWPAIEPFYRSGAAGVVTLDQLAGLSRPVVAAGIVVVAVGCFLAAEQAEIVFSRWADRPAPPSDARLRNASLAVVGAVAAAGLALSAPSAEAVTDPAPTWGTIAPQDLAERLVTDPSSMWVVDARSAAACAAGRVPTAQCWPEKDAAAFVAGLPATRTLVVYVADDGSKVPDEVRSFGGPVSVLQGGFAAFEREVLLPPAAPVEATLASAQTYALRAALHGQLTGSAAAVAPVAVKPVAVKRATKKGGGC